LLWLNGAEIGPEKSTVTTTKANQYTRRNIETMEMLYGTGYLSMGGDDEVANIVARVEVAGKDVLDIGCGLGGALIALTRNHHARHAHGVDIDTGVLERANALVSTAGLQERISLTRFEPGPLPLADASFDLVFLTAVSCHLQDLVPFFTEIRRVIRPGGQLVGGEWFRHLDNQAYRTWDELLRKRGLNFYFVTAEQFEASLLESGFEVVSLVDRSSAMAALAQGYLDRVQYELKDRLLDAMGEDDYAALLEWTRIRANGLAQGGAGYGHFVAEKTGI
jgi:SAM-dependent methyltransferase